MKRIISGTIVCIAGLAVTACSGPNSRINRTTASTGASLGDGPPGTATPATSPQPVRDDVKVEPGTRYSWQEGGWMLVNNNWIWVPGYWQQEDNGATWMPGSWARTDQGWLWTRGRWSNQVGGSAEGAPELEEPPIEPPQNIPEASGEAVEQPTVPTQPADQGAQ